MERHEMKFGIIEGFYGEDWGWEARQAILPFMVENNMNFFIYAPKSDAYLRSKWQMKHPHNLWHSIRSFGDQCRNHGIEFGLGLTPYALHSEWEQVGRGALRKRLHTLRALKLDSLAILFDDMPGDLPNLATIQADILKLVADSGVAEHILMCPTYYSDAPILDRLFGNRPKDYLNTLGDTLDQGVDVFWTGPNVLSKEYTSDHLLRVASELGRKPFIWDNYPVNDGPRMSRFLHLKAPDRPAHITDAVAGFAINPMNQPNLSRIPLRAMAQSLTGRCIGDLTEQTIAAIQRELSVDAAKALTEDYRTFQTQGLDGLDGTAITALLSTYSSLPHPAAKEVCRWLRGEYVVSADILTDT
jgi:hyaluronoglucosaminidase